MDELSYALRLGPGIHMDINGTLISSLPPRLAVYEPPFELPIDVNKARDTLKEIGETLKGLKKDKDIKLQLHVWGASEDILKVLDGIGQLASALGVVGTAVSAAVGLLKIFGILKSGPDPLVLLLNERFDQLNRTVAAITQIINAQNLGEARNALDAFSDSIETFRAQQDQLTLSEYLQRHAALESAHPIQWTHLARPLDPSTWMSTVLEKDNQTWKWLQTILFTLPTGQRDRASARPVPLPAAPYFDHRLMVPVVAGWVARYLAGLRTLSPELRSNGDFRESIETAANKVEVLAEQMRELCLARTFYGPEHFQSVWGAYVHKPLFGTPVIRRGARTPWPVGAMDVRYHDDAFFKPFLSAIPWGLDSPGAGSQTKCACMDFGFVPPAVLSEVGSDGLYYLILNPQECADAANAQAEQDYANLLSLSGYVELLRLVALLRHHAAEPLQSQSITPGAPVFWIEKIGSKSVTVHSRPAYGTGQVVTAVARHEARNCAATVRIRTQPVKRALPARYKIKLRTLVGQTDYDAFFSTAYEPDPDRLAEYKPNPDKPPMKRLVITDHTQMQLDEEQLTLGEWTSSPRDAAIHREGTVLMTADTVDWWIPVIDSVASLNDEVRSLSAFHQLVDDFGSPDSDSSPGEGASAGPQSSNGLAGQIVEGIGLSRQHVEIYPGLNFTKVTPRSDYRLSDAERKRVTVQYILDWNDENLTVSIRSSAENRSFRIYLVIEEQLIGSGKVLHSAVALPMQGSVTYVPQKFFDDELRAHAQSARIIAREIARRAPDLEDLHPPGPLELGGPGGFAYPLAVEGFAERLRIHRPQVHAELMRSLQMTGTGAG